MRTDRRFVRVYFDDMLRDYPAIYDDDAAFAAWVRLLVAADVAWPTPPELPRSLKPRALRQLTSSGLVILLPGQRFQIRGYEAERSRRQEAARRGADVRWHSKGNADLNADGDANASANAMPNTEASTKTNGSTRTPPERGARDLVPVHPVRAG